MSVIVEDRTSLVRGTVKSRVNLFLRFFAEGVVNTAEPNTPTDTGRMKRDVLKQVLGLSGKIKWNKNYAAIQESKQFKHYTKAGTGPHFARNAIQSTLRDAQSIAKKVGLI